MVRTNRDSTCGTSRGADRAGRIRLGPGVVFETVFRGNPKPESGFRFRATHLNGQRSPKAILSNDERIVPGRACRVRTLVVDKPNCQGRGAIVVEYVGPTLFQLDEAYYIDRVAALSLQAMLESGLNVILDGPQGCGKTVLVRLLARALEMEHVFFNCSPCYEATDFLASLQVRATESGQVETAWVPTDILRALEAAHANPGTRYLIFLDEFNRCREMARNGIMPALDATRRMYNPVSGSTIKIPENTLWIAAINNGAEFTGTTTVDPSQLDRFAPLKIGYPPEKEEVRVLRHRHPNASKGALEKIVRLANAVRSSKRLNVDLSVRATEEVAILLEHPNFREGFDGDAVNELVKNSFCGRFPGRWDDPASEAGLVWNELKAHL